MQAELKFDLPADEEVFEITVHAQDWRRVVEEIERTVHDWIKHGHDFPSADVALAEVRQVLWTELEDRGLILYP